MKCEPFKTNDGGRGFVCGRGRQKIESCSLPACTGPGICLCDYPITVVGKAQAKAGMKVRAAETCSKRICPSHATPIGIPGDIHYCPAHVQEAKIGQPNSGGDQLDLFRERHER